MNKYTDTDMLMDRHVFYIKRTGTLPSPYNLLHASAPLPTMNSSL